MCFQKDFWFDEVSIIKGELYFHEGFMIIKVLKSKNDQLCKGDESERFFRKCLALLVPCPFFHPSSSRDLIFRPMSRGNSSFKLVSQDEPISYTTIREVFRKDLRSFGG